jgi:hypothetical protein
MIRLNQLIELSSCYQIVPVTCLDRATVLQWMATRRGIPVQLCIGVEKTISGMNAHAWVKFDGEPVCEKSDIAERFKVLTPIGNIPLSRMD